MKRNERGEVTEFEPGDDLVVGGESLEVGESAANMLNASRLAILKFGAGTIGREDLVSLGILGSPGYKQIPVSAVFQEYPVCSEPKGRGRERAAVTRTGRS